MAVVFSLSTSRIPFAHHRKVLSLILVVRQYLERCLFEECLHYFRWRFNWCSYKLLFFTTSTICYKIFVDFSCYNANPFEASETELDY